MNFGYVVSPRADRDIDEIADYLSEEASLDTGLQFLAELYATLTLLASQPDIGWPCRVRHPELTESKTFRVSARFSNYLIFYRACSDRIEIIRVLHGARDLVAILGREEIE